MWNDIVCITLSDTIVLKGTDGLSEYLQTCNRTDRAILVDMDLFEHVVEIHLLHMALPSIQICYLRVGCNHKILGIEVSQIVFRNVKAECIKEFRRNHLGAGCEFGIMPWIKINEVRIPASIAHSESELNALRFCFDDRERRTGVRTASGIRSLQNFGQRHLSRSDSIREPGRIGHFTKCVGVFGGFLFFAGRVSKCIDDKIKQLALNQGSGHQYGQLIGVLPDRIIRVEFFGLCNH